MDTLGARQMGVLTGAMKRGHGNRFTVELPKSGSSTTKSTTLSAADIDILDSIAARQMGVLTGAMERASGGQPYQKSTCPKYGQVKPTKTTALAQAGLSRQRANEAEHLAQGGPETAPFFGYTNGYTRL